MTLGKEKMELQIQKSWKPKNLHNWNIAGITDLVSRKQNFK